MNCELQKSRWCFFTSGIFLPVFFPIRKESRHRDAVPYGMLRYRGLTPIPWVAQRRMRSLHPRLGFVHHYVVLYGMLRYRGVTPTVAAGWHPRMCYATPTRFHNFSCIPWVPRTLCTSPTAVLFHCYAVLSGWFTIIMNYALWIMHYELCIEEINQPFWESRS